MAFTRIPSLLILPLASLAVGVVWFSLPVEETPARDAAQQEPRANAADRASTAQTSSLCGDEWKPLFAADGLGVTCRHGRMGVVNDDGDVIVPFRYDFVAFPGHSRILVRRETGWTLFDTAGKVLLSNLFTDCGDWTTPVRFWRNGQVFSVVEEAAPGTAPRPYVDVKFGDRGGLPFCGLLIVSRDGAHGLLGNSGQLVLPLDYDEIQADWDEYRLRKGDRWGIADLDGRVLVPPTYESISPYAVLENGEVESHVAVRRGGAVLLSESGAELTRPFDTIGDGSDAGWRVVQRGRRFGVVDNRGNTVLPTSYTEVHVSVGGAIVASRAGRWGAFHGTTTVLPLSFDSVHGPFFGVYLARRGAEVLWFDQSGTSVPRSHLRAMALGSGRSFRSTDDEPIDERVVTSSGTAEAFVIDDPPFDHLGRVEDVALARSLIVTNTTSAPIVVETADGEVIVRFEEQLDGVWRSRPDLDKGIPCGNSYGQGSIRPGHQRVGTALLPPSARGTFRGVVIVDGAPVATQPFQRP